jgi:hypothetical protein
LDPLIDHPNMGWGQINVGGILRDRLMGHMHALRGAIAGRKSIPGRGVEVIAPRPLRPKIDPPP